MSQKTYNHRLNYRIAEETQLLAEEKWIVETLAKIKKERNCLQIERLHLESKKSKLKCGPDKTHTAQSPPPEPTIQTPANVHSSQNSITFEIPIIDSSCNYEELDLSVTKSIFSGHINENIEEYEEDEMDTDEIVIDINMLMNGNTMEQDKD